MRARPEQVNGGVPSLPTSQRQLRKLAMAGLKMKVAFDKYEASKAAAEQEQVAEQAALATKKEAAQPGAEQLKHVYRRLSDMHSVMVSIHDVMGWVGQDERLDAAINTLTIEAARNAARTIDEALTVLDPDYLAVGSFANHLSTE